MPIKVIYPGVFIEEITSPVRAITGVSTSITAFIGRALKGPTDTAKTIHSFPDYNHSFGGLWKKSNMSYAVYHYFLNGGTDAAIVRANNGALKATYEMNGTTLKLEASNPGEWANDFEIIIDHKIDKVKEINDSSIFNLNIIDNKKGTQESFLNVSTNSNSSMYLEEVLEAESKLVRKLSLIHI